MAVNHGSEWLKKSVADGNRQDVGVIARCNLGLLAGNTAKNGMHGCCGAHALCHHSAYGLLRAAAAIAPDAATAAIEV